MTKFLIIGSKTLPAEELVNLYGLETDKCILATQDDPTSYVGHGRVIFLSERPRGDYKEFLEARIKEHTDFYGEEGEDKIKKAGRKPKFKTDVEWYKKLKKKGKG